MTGELLAVDCMVPMYEEREPHGVEINTDFKKRLKGHIVIVIIDLLTFTNGTNRNQQVGRVFGRKGFCFGKQ